MPIDKQAVGQLMKRIAQLRKRRERLIQKRDTTCLRMTLEGKDGGYYRQTLYSWQLEHTEWQLEACLARLLEVKRDAQ